MLVMSKTLTPPQAPQTPLCIERQKKRVINIKRLTEKSSIVKKKKLNPSFNLGMIQKPKPIARKIVGHLNTNSQESKMHKPSPTHNRTCRKSDTLNHRHKPLPRPPHSHYEQPRS
ncbi:unnamed protein product [Ilex paraguariensis]|uniref:Uncharacterized protein n=1 Tax=Ilex paraguariensis TaxID=185542 RepID=A0ABC8QPK5_9AQUA